MSPVTIKRIVRVQPVVVPCSGCERTHVVAVRFEDGAETVVCRLPDNCSCGASLDTPQNIRDAIDTAARLIAEEQVSA